MPRRFPIADRFASRVAGNSAFGGSLATPADAPDGFLSTGIILKELTLHPKLRRNNGEHADRRRF
jgi:hypothetical protein